MESDSVRKLLFMEQQFMEIAAEIPPKQTIIRIREIAVLRVLKIILRNGSQPLNRRFPPRNFQARSRVCFARSRMPNLSQLNRRSRFFSRPAAIRFSRTHAIV